MFDIYFFIQIVLLLAACLSCYYSGKEKGVDELITVLIQGRMIDSDKLQKLTKILTKSNS